MGTPTQFVPSFPCFAVMNRDTVAECVQIGGSDIGVIILTDDDLARRYRMQNNLFAPKIVFDGAPELVLFLTELLPSQVTHIAFDPGESQAVTASIAEFVQKTLDAINREENQNP